MTGSQPTDCQPVWSRLASRPENFASSRNLAVDCRQSSRRCSTPVPAAAHKRRETLPPRQSTTFLLKRSQRADGRSLLILSASSSSRVAMRLIKTAMLPLTIEALRGAGLIGREEARPARLLSERLLPSLRAAVREFVDDAVEAPPAVAAALLDLAGLSGVSRDAIRRLERGGSFKPTLVVRLAGAPVGLARRSGPVDGLSPSLPRQPRGRAGRSSHTRPASPSASLLGGYDADRG